jgi:glutamate carboxypeptidase
VKPIEEGAEMTPSHPDDALRVPAPDLPDDVDPRRVMEHLDGLAGEMLDLLEELVLIESPSHEPATHAPVRERLGQELAQLDFRVRDVPGHGAGDHLFARPAAPSGPHRQLLLGHFDTVWPVGTLESMPVTRTDGRMAGPGSFDMKCGLVQLIFALRALRDLGVTPEVTPVVFVNSDEEIGSRSSNRWIKALSRRSVRALVLEGALGLEGALKVGRKGIGGYTLRVRATGAAATDPAGRTLPVLEMAHQIQLLFELNEPSRGVTVNVGTIDGGLRPDLAVPEATARVDVRAPTHADASELDATIRALRPVEEGVELQVDGGFGRPPMEQTPRNQALWRRARALGATLGLDLEPAVVGGGSDANETSQHTASLDGLGAVGEGAHAAHESVVVAAVPQRAALLALLLASPAELEPVDVPPAGEPA